MTFLQLIFYGFSAVAIFSGMMVVASSNPVRSVLFLVLAFFASAGLWMILHAEFLALILVLVYVGAVMTLFLFVVMMLNVDKISFKEGFVRYLPFAIAAALLIMGMLIVVFGSHRFDIATTHMPAEPANYNNIADLGMLIYTNYAYPFEIAAVLLLTAIVAAISLTHQKKLRRKSQNISKQIAVQAKDRMRLIDMPSAAKNKPTPGP